MYDDYDDYDKPQPRKRKKKLPQWDFDLPILGAIVGLFGILYQYTTAPFWVILGALFWIMTILTSLINMGIVASSYTLMWYALLCGIPFYMLLVPGLILVISYEEGRSRLAQNKPHLRNMFNSVDLFIPNSMIMSIIMMVVLGIVTATAIAQSETTSFANVVVWASISVLSPLFTYACARLAAAGVK